MAKPTVWASYEDDTGNRCVDIQKHGQDRWAWAECRRDPEDATGWRTLSTSGTVPSESAAMGDALANVAWLKAVRDG